MILESRATHLLDPMRNRDLQLAIEDTPGATLSQRIATALTKAILEGRLPPGSMLPGSRTLAALLGVNRMTVVPALQELEAEGWLVTLPQRGTFVAGELPSGGPRFLRPGQGAASGPTPSPAGFDLPSFLQPVSVTAMDALLLMDGAPDPRLAPAEEMARGYQRALRRHGARLLQDRDPLGALLLREAVAGWASERHGFRVTADQVLITRGSRGALALLAASLFRAGTLAAVENPGNRGAWEVLQKGARLSLRPVPVDAGGMDPEALADLLAKERVGMLYLTPRRQFPTAVSMTRERGAEILRLAAKHRVAVLEDDYDGEFDYTKPRAEPLMAQDRTGQVIYIGSLSRLIAPGLRLGYLILPLSLAPFLAREKRAREDQGDPVFEWTMADLIRDGDLTRHLRRTRKIYETRRDFLVALLHKRLSAHLETEAPSGGMGVWLRVKDGVDAAAWVKAARTCGLVMNPPAHFYLGTPQPCFRMGFAQADETELREAVARLERGLAQIQRA